MWISTGGTIATVLLVCEAFVFTAIAGAVLYFLIRWTHQARSRVRPLTSTARSVASAISSRTQSVSRSIVSPLMEVEARAGGVAAAVRRLLKNGSGGRGGSDEA